jgi:hypothetical protein
MDITDRHVIVSARALGEHTEWVERVLTVILDRQAADGLRGSLAELRAGAVYEPV